MAIKHEESQQPNNSPKSQTRRTALKKMLVGTGVAAGAAALPCKWVKPVVDKVLIPAHAQCSVEFSISCKIDVEQAPAPKSGKVRLASELFDVEVSGEVGATCGASVAGLDVQLQWSSDIPNKVKMSKQIIQTDLNGEFKVNIGPIFVPCIDPNYKLSANVSLTDYPGIDSECEATLGCDFE